MRFLTLPLLAAVLTFNLAAEDSAKTKTKSDITDPVTGERTKTKTRVKAESDGDYKVDSKSETTGGVAGKTKSKVKVRAEGDGDYKEKVKTSGPEGKTETKTKIDK
jgi:maltose-binding protein MalE